MSNWKQLTDDQLGQAWANRLMWYLMEMREGIILLDDVAHARMIGEMRAIDAELLERDLPANPRYTDAFEKRELLPEEEMRQLGIGAYGRPVTFVGIER